MVGRERGFRRANLAVLVALALAPYLTRADDRESASSSSAGASWDVGASVLLYVLREEPNYFQPTVTVDHGMLHLEARYNYEARETASAWLGANFSFGDDLKLGLVPMVGGVFGQTRGIATGLTITLDWGPLALWSQSEYVFDLADSSNDYFYVWSEISVTGPEWLRVGLVLQRTRVFQTATELQGGPLAGVSFWKLSGTVYFFSPGQDDQFVVVALAGTF